MNRALNPNYIIKFPCLKSKKNSKLSCSFFFEDEFNDDVNPEDSSSRTSKSRRDEAPSKTSSSRTHRPSQEPHSSSSSSSHREDSRRRSRPSSTSGSSATPKPISSCIGAVIKRKHDDDDDDDDDSDEDRKDSGDETKSRHSSRVSSVVTVSDNRRRSREERQRKLSADARSALRPSKSILLRALDAANKSVVSTNSREEASNKSIADLKLAAFRSKRSETNSQPQAESVDSKPKRLKSSESRETTSQDSLPTRQVQIADKDEPKTSTRPIMHDEDEEDEDDDKQTIKIDMNQSNTNKEVSAANNTKFIITLNGLRDDQFLNKLQSSNKANMQGEFGDMNELDELDYDETYDDYGNNDDEMNEYGDDQMLEETETGASMYMNENTADSMQDSQDGQHQMAKKRLIRCTFWPLCEKGDACLYLHPNKPCTAFPNCQFGQLCHYVHPNCRYDGFCTRLDCPYTHNLKRGSVNPTEAAQLTTTQTDQPMDQSVLAGATVSTTATKPTHAGQDVPRVTINKIQPFASGASNPFSLVNKTSGSDASGGVVSTGASTTSSTLAVPKNATSTAFKSHFVPVPTGRVLFPLQSSAFHAGSQYKLVHGGKPASANPLPVCISLSLINIISSIKHFK
jgi:hypothetical protein